MIAEWNIAPPKAVAFVYAGYWVVDCIYPSCYSAERVYPGDVKYHCTNCHHIADIEWPDDVEAIERVLRIRPVPNTRNWAPAGHRQAISCGFPDGQTVDDLQRENAENL